MVTLVAAASAVAAGPVAAAPSCPPGIGVSLVPSGSAHDPRDANYIVAEVAPGSGFSRQVRFCNGTSSTVTLATYANAATVRDGSLLPTGTGHVGNELTSWTKVAPTTLHLAPQSAALVDVQVRVPPGASGGERYGVVYGELPARPGASGVRVASRVGMRMYVLVHAPGQSDRSGFTVDSLQAERRADGIPVVKAQVHNTGARALDITGELRLSDGPGGTSAGPFPAQLGTTLAPGQTEPVTVPLAKDLPDGPWRATITLQSGLLRRAAQATILFPHTAGVAAAPVKATAVPLTKNRDVVVPIALALLLFGLIALLLLWWRRRTLTDPTNRVVPPG